MLQIIDFRSLGRGSSTVQKTESGRVTGGVAPPNNTRAAVPESEMPDGKRRLEALIGFLCYVLRGCQLEETPG